MWRCTRYVAVHPNRRGALPTDRVQRPNKQEQTRNWHTEPLTATPLHAHLGPTGGRMGTPPTPSPALRPTPAHSDTSYTLKCEEPVNLWTCAWAALPRACHRTHARMSGPRRGSEGPRARRGVQAASAPRRTALPDTKCPYPANCSPAHQARGGIHAPR